jgi:hypothetical protein
MVGESEEEKLSLGGRCERYPWLVLKMPVARQAMHETCVRGIALSSLASPASNSDLADGERLRPLPVSPRVAGPESRRAGEPAINGARSERRLLTDLCLSPRTENKNRISHEIESESHWPIMSSCIDLVGCAHQDLWSIPIPRNSCRNWAAGCCSSSQLHNERGEMSQMQTDTALSVLYCMNAGVNRYYIRQGTVT